MHPAPTRDCPLFSKRAGFLACGSDQHFMIFQACQSPAGRRTKCPIAALRMVLGEPRLPALPNLAAPSGKAAKCHPVRVACAKRKGDARTPRLLARSLALRRGGAMPLRATSILKKKNQTYEQPCPWHRGSGSKQASERARGARFAGIGRPRHRKAMRGVVSKNWTKAAVGGQSPFTAVQQPSTQAGLRPAS